MSPEEYVHDLLEVMRRNRALHRRRWRKVREDRIGKLWPELGEAEVRAVVDAAVAAGRLERCSTEDRDTGLPVPALHLLNWGQPL